MTLRIGSLCSGYGGLDLAVEYSFGAETVWYAEIGSAARILSQRFPGLPNLGDITRVRWLDVPRVDILTAGYPCQPFSQAGKRRGTDDERHLWPHIAEAIGALAPPIIVLENVSAHRSLGFGAVLGDLAARGYDARWISVRASDAGAPHRRERLIHPRRCSRRRYRGITRARSRA